MENLKDLLEKGKFVEVGREIADIKQKINELRRSKRFNEANKIEKQLKDLIDDAFKNIKEKSEQFLKLSPEERLKMAFILAAKTTVVENMKTTQIRKILSMSNRISREIKIGKLKDISSETAKMRYILAYTASRHKTKKSDPITPILEISDKILPKLTTENYETFHEFLQAIVAYHKFLGGGD